MAGASFYFTSAKNGGVRKRQATATHGLKGARTAIGKYSLAVRVIDLWNRLNRRRVWYSETFAIC
jgi:hypothetical protein